MSGYLQRLAGSVIQPKETVRPLVGSVFSAHNGHQEPEDFSAASKTPLLGETGSAKSRQLSELQDLSEALLPRDEITASTVKDVRAIANELSGVSPLMSIPRQLSSMAREHRDGETSLSPETAGTRETVYKPLMVNSPVYSAQKSIPEVPSTEPREAVYTPLIVNSPAYSAQKSIDVSSNLSSPMKQDKRKPAASRAAEREPDEIQIHIGRIEISAVPQAPAITVVKAARKSSSLEEYLQRRDRRSV